MILPRAMGPDGGQSCVCAMKQILTILSFRLTELRCDAAVVYDVLSVGFAKL